jgi:hypothetical protein
MSTTPFIMLLGDHLLTLVEQDGSATHRLGVIVRRQIKAAVVKKE